MSRERIEFGKTGEDLACLELTRRGYAIVARRHRNGLGEIDIIARDGATLVFVEVKARDGLAYGAGGEAVTWRKRRRLVRLATDYLTRQNLTACACRFDVVSIDYGGGTPAVEVFQNAFGTDGW
jgi:putative endonuclease